LSPAGGEVCVGYLSDGGEGHRLIIRLRAHSYWIAEGAGSMQRVETDGDIYWLMRE
jgi:hypothetical protein